MINRSNIVAPFLWAVVLAFFVGACDQTTSGASTDNPTDTKSKSEGSLVRRTQDWIAADKAEITPGVQTYTAGSGQCTTNYVFTDAKGRIYLGQAAHCAGKGESEETNGCKTTSLPLGTKVTFNTGGTPLSSGKQVAEGRLVYSSWVTMNKRAEKDASTCAYNDFALILLDARYKRLVNPSVPFWGGPVALSSGSVTNGESAYSYGNSSLRGGISQLSPQEGTFIADEAGGGHWSHVLHALTPGIPGDSGSAYLDGSGRAVGTLSTIGLSIPVSNTVGDLRRELMYARAYSGLPDLRLELGTEPFRQR